MSPLMKSHGRSVVAPRWWVLLLALASIAGLATAVPPAVAYWSVNAPLEGAGTAAAATVGGGATPTVAVTGGIAVTVTWGTSTLSTGAPVSGYLVRRYSATGGELATTGAGCSGSIAAESCTEAAVPAGTWRYTVTPTFGAQWRGAESSLSGAVARGAASLSLTKSLYGAPLPAATTGTASGFAAGEPITYAVGGVATAGAPAVADASGNIAITELTIPSLADGPATVAARGSISGVSASAGILIDTTPPVLNSTQTPEANAAGWNNSPVTLTGNVSDGDGSGMESVRGTSDGSDPLTSPTAGPWDGSEVLLTESAVIKFYGTDLAGNVSAVQTLDVKIDVTPPVFTGETVSESGGAYLGLGQSPDPALAWYRGVDAGSFRFRIIPIDDGGAPTVAVGGTALQGVDTGFTLLPTNTTTPETDGSFLTQPVSWAAGTTSSPVGTVTVTDAAGNITTVPGTIDNDSSPPAGGSITAGGLTGTGAAYVQSTTIALSLGAATDAQSGLAPGAQLLRSSAALSSASGVTDGVCGVYTADAQIGEADPAATVSDTVPQDNRCYRYRYSVADHVGNVATWSTADIKVQSAAAGSLLPGNVSITPLTGTTAQLVAGNTLFYKPAQTGTFRVTATSSDPWSGTSLVSFPAPAGFSGGGAVADAGDAATFSTVYGWSSNAASPSPGVQVIAASDHAGHSRTLAGAFSLVADSSPPVNALTLGTASSAYLSGTDLYYRPTVSGSFTLVNTPTDAGSGPASTTYPALALSRWTHPAQTVATPSGGPYASSTFSWASNPSAPSTYTVTSSDQLGNVQPVILTFRADQTSPSGGSISYADSTITTASVPLTLSIGSDAGAGIDAAKTTVSRDRTTLLSPILGICSLFPGNWTPVALVGGADTSVTDGSCYRYRLQVYDRVGNQRTYSSTSTVRVDLA